MSNASHRKHICVVVSGHVDCGKSTLCGRLLHEMGCISDPDLQKVLQQARNLGKESFFYAFCVDKTKEERARGVTIYTTSHPFYTNSYDYSLYNISGHRDFIKNSITGFAECDVGILIVPANRGGFETSIAKGNHKKGEIQGQTRQHARLMHLFGIEQIIVGINKMDSHCVRYSQGRFNEIKYEMERMLTKIGYTTFKIPFIPLSAFNGDNLTKRTENMKWYKGFRVRKQKETVDGYTLLDALEKVVKPPKRANKKPFRLSVLNKYKIKGVGNVITGKVHQGTIKCCEKVKLYPSEARGTVFSIEMHHKRIDVGYCGDNIGINMFNCKNFKDVKRGDVMVIDDKKRDPNPPKPMKQFAVLAFIQCHPSRLYAAKEGRKGYTALCHVRTARAPCELKMILWKMGKCTNKKKVYNPEYVESGDQMEAIFELEKAMVVIPFDICKPYGRMAMMDSNSLIAIGKVIDVHCLLLNDKEYGILIYGYCRSLFERKNRHIADDIKHVILEFVRFATTHRIH